MSRGQVVVLSCASLFFLLLYFGFDTKTNEQKGVEEKRLLSATSTDINALLLGAKNSLGSSEGSEVLLAEANLSAAKSESEKTEAYKKLSSAWYKINRFAIAGYYAGQVAEMEGTDEAWSIAGAIYNRGMNYESEEKIKDYCTTRAIEAFENAISLNPGNIDHQVNLAVCYAENPPQDQPMKGVMMLLDVNKKNPENVAALTSLGRFGIQTGQFEKAVGRLEKALQLEPNNIKVNCLLAQAYQGFGQLDKAKTFQDICDRFRQK
ncbi:MAG: tetratricopeptide repeat protein [Bacteroidota bacterium]